MRKRIRLSYIVLQFLAIWLFAHGIMVLMLLTQLDAFEAIRLSTDELQKATTESLVKAKVTMSLSNTLGAFIGLIASIFTMGIKKLSYLNSVFAFLIFLSIGWSKNHGWHVLKDVFLAAGSHFDGALFYLINGSVIIILAVICLFVTKSKSEKRLDVNSKRLPHVA